MELFVETHVWSQDRQKGGATVCWQPRSTLCGMFIQPFYFISYYFYWIEYDDDDDDFFFHFEETYNSRLRERYWDDPLTHPNFDPDLWIEVGSSGGPDNNRVYGLSNTTTENLWSACSVLTIGSSKSVSSTQSEDIMALKQHTANLIEKYEQLSANYEQLRQIVMNMTSQSGDTCPLPFWPYNNQPPSPPPAPSLC
jgi:hypothetical protein